MLEQLDLLGEDVVPVLRREFAALRPAHVPDAPTHAARLAAARAGGTAEVRGEGHRVDRWTGSRAEDDNTLLEAR